MSKHGWTYKKLGEIGKVITGSTPSTKDPASYSSNDYCLVKPSDLRQIGITKITDSEFHISTKAFIESRRLPKGSVLTTCIGIIGKVGVLEVDATCNQQINAVIPSEQISSPFLAYSILSQRKIIEAKANAPVVPIINKSNFSKISIPVPPMAEQEAIVAELDEINEAIAALQQQVADLDTLAQSTFYDMFGDPVTNPKAWPVKKLDESVQEMFLGPFGSALKVSSYVSESESFAMVYEQKHAIQGTINLDNHYINKEKFDSLARFEVKPKDFIMSCRGTIGRIFQLPDNAPKGIIHPSLMKIRIKNEVYDYSFFVVLLQKIIAEQTTKGNCVQMAITAKELGNMYFILPPLSLQQEFAAKVEAIEAAKAELNAQIAEMQTLLASRMDYYFD